MKITQRDIAHLSDADIKRIIMAVVRACPNALGSPYPGAGPIAFWQVLIAALNKALKERSATLAALTEDEV